MMQHDIERNKETWSRICGHIRGRVNDETYERWFASMVLVKDTGTHLVLRVADASCLFWVEANYSSLIQEATISVLGARELSFESSESQEEEVTAEPVSVVQGMKAANADQTARKGKNSNLNQNYNFENYVVGSNNQFAHAIAKAVAGSTKSQFNPFFIHGGSGLGKTHLMQAIGNEILKKTPNSTVLYLSSEQFVNEFIDAIQTQSLTKFRRKYRKVDVLLLDDVQFLAGKDKTQEEFFHTFNTLFNGEKQIVLSSDRPAGEISNLEPRLASRFESGLPVEIQTPNMETRLAILQQKRKEWKVNVSDNILQFLADRIRQNVRRLEGGLMRIATYASISGTTPDVVKAETLLRDILREENQKQVSIDAIQKRVSEEYDIRLADMVSRRRPARIAYPRQIAMYLCRTLTNASLQEIGDAFGGRDHGTVIHANKTIEARMQEDASLKDRIEHLKEELR